MAIKDIDQLNGSGAIEDTARFAVWPPGSSIPERGTMDLIQNNLAIWLGSVMHPGYRANTWYATLGTTRETATAVPAADQLYLYPFRLWRRMTIYQLGVRCITGGAGSAVKLGIWDSVAGRPQGAPMLANNTGAATTAAGEINLGVTETLIDAGAYWAGQLYTGTLPTMLAIANTTLVVEPMIGRSALTSSLGISALSLAETYAGNLPTIVGGDTLNEVSTGIPHIWMRSAN